jgi:hypothetical protein
MQPATRPAGKDSLMSHLLQVSSSCHFTYYPHNVQIRSSGFCVAQQRLSLLCPGRHGDSQLCARPCQRRCHYITAGLTELFLLNSYVFTYSQGAISGLVFALGVADASQYAAGALAHLSHHSMHNQEVIGKEPGVMQRIAAMLGDANVSSLHYCVLALANLGCAVVNQEKMAATPGLVAQASACAPPSFSQHLI